MSPKYPDFFWVFPTGERVADVRHVYAKNSTVFDVMLSVGHVDGEISVPENISTSTFFGMVRDFCHKGILPAEKMGMRDLLKRLNVARCYQLDDLSRFLARRVVLEMDASNAFMLYVENGEPNGDPVSTYIRDASKEFFRVHAQSILAKIDKLPSSSVSILCNLLKEDVNASEEEIFAALWRIIENKEEFETLAWECVRPEGLRPEFLIRFKDEMSPRLLLNALAKSMKVETETNAVDSGPVLDEYERPAKRRRRYYRPTSNYARNLLIDGEIENFWISAPDESTDRKRVIYFVCKKEARRAPFERSFNPIQIDSTRIDFNIKSSSDKVVVKGRIWEDVRILFRFSVINFQSERWKRVETETEPGRTCFSCPLITFSTLESTKGYQFSPHHYPNFSEGQHMLVRCSISKKMFVDE